MQNIASDGSGVDEEEQNEILQLLQNITRDEDESTESSSDDCDHIPSLKMRLKSSTGCVSISAAVCGRESARNRGTCESNDFTSDDDDDDDDDALVGKDSSVWKPILPKLGSMGRFCSQNILCHRPVLTAFAATRVQQDNEVSAFHLFFDESMVLHICKCTIVDGRRIKGNDWNIELAKMDKFPGLVIARGISGGRTLPLKSMWSAQWGNNLFISTMRRDRFVEIMRFLRSDIKSDRRQRLQSDKLGLISCVWNGFIDNYKRSCLQSNCKPNN